MIKRIECFIPICDVCGNKLDEGADYVVHFDTEAEAQAHAIESCEYGGAEGQMIDSKLCCQNCWAFDDEDGIVIRERK